MKEEEFLKNNFGKIVWESHGMFYRFEPKELPIKYQPKTHLIPLSIKTALQIGRLDGLTEKLSKDEIELLRLPFILKEAKLSLEIEGTISTLSDIYKEEKEKETDHRKREDIEEIRNYVAALNYGVENLNNQFSEKLIKDIHKILLRGVRGYNKEPGVYKTQQNAVGQREDDLGTAKFVSASPQTTPFLMKNLVEYINKPSHEDIFQKIAVVHYQFETIHPFRDGNGRLGRLLIMLILIRERLISQPLLYISEYFNRNRSTYTDLLYNVSSKGNINEWITFFLEAIKNQTERSLNLIKELEEYKREIQKEIEEVTRSHNIHKVVNLIFANPYITIKEVSDVLGLSVPATSNILHTLEGKGILREITGKKSRKIFVAEKILQILNT